MFLNASRATSPGLVARAGRTAQSISPDATREAGPGLIAEDLPGVLPRVFRRLYDEFGIDY
jgi:hypothetical protein